MIRSVFIRDQDQTDDQTTMPSMQEVVQRLEHVEMAIAILAHQDEGYQPPDDYQQPEGSDDGLDPVTGVSKSTQPMHTMPGMSGTKPTTDRARDNRTAQMIAAINKANRKHYS